MSHYIIVRDKGRIVRADYGGGAYVDLTFGSEGHHPTEVINVWDYSTSTSEIATMLEANSGMTQNQAVRIVVKNWIADNDVEWPEWYGDYIANARI